MFYDLNVPVSRDILQADDAQLARLVSLQMHPLAQACQEYGYASIAWNVTLEGKSVAGSGQKVFS